MTTEARDLCVASHPYRGVQDFFVRIGCVQLNRGVKTMMDTVRIRQATLEDFPALAVPARHGRGDGWG
jgi:hypothetical protein